MFPTRAELIELSARALWGFLNAFLGGIGADATGLVNLDLQGLAIVAAFGSVLPIIRIYVAQKADATGALAKTLRGAPDATSSRAGMG